MKTHIDVVYREIGTIPVTTCRDIVPFQAPPLPTAPPPPSSAPFAGFIEDVDPGKMSPRQAANLGMDLYIAGVLSWDEYSMLSFQPELHPDYNQTIGALIGEKAEPDRCRDFVEIWHNRLKFERKYNPKDKPRIERTARIARVLHQI